MPSLTRHCTFETTRKTERIKLLEPEPSKKVQRFKQFYRGPPLPLC